MVVYDISTQEFIFRHDELRVLRLPVEQERWKFSDAPKLLGHCVANRFRLNIHEGNEANRNLPSDWNSFRDGELTLRAEAEIKRGLRFRRSAEQIAEIERYADEYAIELLYPTEHPS
ncbi:MAG TPA: hypothetical protein VG604_00020 [Candidatus Saccharimonadales bacterium]|nr:hypothetical protein [Candidatus Saccharimonadales bacterium]